MAVQTLVVGGGCFWCLDGVFRRLQGVLAVVSGYAGGTTDRPTYEQVCSGNTGHAEVVQIEYDDEKITVETLLEVFFAVHDPTTLNRQGHDVGTQYRSVVFYANAAQQQVAKQAVELIDKSQRFVAPVVTTIEPLSEFYPAEACHQDYFARNPDNRYCQVVVNPKLQKFMKQFAHRV